MTGTTSATAAATVTPTPIRKARDSLGEVRAQEREHADERDHETGRERHGTRRADLAGIHLEHADGDEHQGNAHQDHQALRPRRC